LIQAIGRVQANAFETLDRVGVENKRNWSSCFIFNLIVGEDSLIVVIDGESNLESIQIVALTVLRSQKEKIKELQV
jgi:hypothetical protein